MTHNRQNYLLPFHVFTYIFEKKWLTLQENNEGTYCQNKVKKINEGLDFKILVFKMSFLQITFIIMIK